MKGDAVCTIAIAVSSLITIVGCHCGCAHAGAPAASFKLPHSPGGYFLHAAGPLWVYVHPPYGDKSGGRKDHRKVEDDDSPHFDPAGNSGICDKAQQGNRCADHHTVMILSSWLLFKSGQVKVIQGKISRKQVTVKQIMKIKEKK